MTTTELIAKLAEYPPNTSVYVEMWTPGKMVVKPYDCREEGSVILCWEPDPLDKLPALRQTAATAR